MATPQEEMTSLEVVKLIEAEADEEGDIFEELSNQDIKEIYQQLKTKRGFGNSGSFIANILGCTGSTCPPTTWHDRW